MLPAQVPVAISGDLQLPIQQVCAAQNPRRHRRHGARVAGRIGRLHADQPARNIDDLIQPARGIGGKGGARRAHARTGGRRRCQSVSR